MYCCFMTQMLKSVRSTSSLIQHLRRKHGIAETTPLAPSAEPPNGAGYASRQSKDHDEEEEEPPPENVVKRFCAPKSQRQLLVESFLTQKPSLRVDMLRLVCESNVSIRQIETSKVLRRVLSRANPNDPPPPKSRTTVKKYRAEDASKIRNEISAKLKGIRASGTWIPERPSER